MKYLFHNMKAHKYGFNCKFMDYKATKPDLTSQYNDFFDPDGGVKPSSHLSEPDNNNTNNILTG